MKEYLKKGIGYVGAGSGGISTEETISPDWDIISETAGEGVMGDEQPGV